MHLHVSKKAGTYADALCAIGCASLLRELSGVTVQVRDADSEYTVACKNGRPPFDWGPPSPGFTYLWRSSAEHRPIGGDVFDYEAEQAIASAALKKNASESAMAKVAESLSEMEQSSRVVSPQYRFAALIEKFLKRSGDPNATKPIGWQTDRKLYRWLTENPGMALNAVNERLLSQSGILEFNCTSTQMLNPSAGKGISSAKTVANKPTAFKLLDSFDEWMKLRGLWTGLVGYPSGDKFQDFKFFAICPGDISVEFIEQMRHDLQALPAQGSVKMEIEVLLRLLQLLLLHSEAMERGGIPLLHRRPRQIVRGLQMAFFQKMGQSPALMNDSFLPLPDWFVVDTVEDVNAYQSISEEPFGSLRQRLIHRRDSGPLSALHESRSEDLGLLQKYLRWITSGELFDLLEFHVSFAPHLLRRMAAREYSPAFKLEILHTLLFKGYPTVNQIIESIGFQNIATAIRYCTTRAAWEKRKELPNAREIRFGLAQRFKQRIKAGQKEFVEELSEFVQQYSWEVEYRLEGKSHQVFTSDLDDVVSLIETHGHKLVGMLLLAYGFARADGVGAKQTEELESATA